MEKCATGLDIILSRRQGGGLLVSVPANEELLMRYLSLLEDGMKRGQIGIACRVAREGETSWVHFVDANGNPIWPFSFAVDLGDTGYVQDFLYSAGEEIVIVMLSKGQLEIYNETAQTA